MRIADDQLVYEEFSGYYNFRGEFVAGYNSVNTKSTRWVFNYADAPAPLAPVKLPLQFQ